MTTEQINFDVYQWEQIQLNHVPEGAETPVKTNLMSELLNEFNQAPEPVTPPEPEPAAIPQPENGPSGFNTGPTGPVSASSWGKAHEGQRLSAKMMMQGWDTAFASAGVMITDRPEKFEYYGLVEKKLNELSNMLAEVMAFYGWDISPMAVFSVGFLGNYSAKGFEIYKDYKAGKQTHQTLSNEVEMERLRTELINLRKENKTTVNKPGAGRPSGSKSRPGSKKPGPKTN